MALYPLPGRTTANVLHYEEGWKVWTGSFTLSADPESGRLLLDECEPGEVVLSGLDTGTGSFKHDKFRSNGTVDGADDPFTGWDVEPWEPPTPPPEDGVREPRRPIPPTDSMSTERDI